MKFDQLLYCPPVDLLKLFALPFQMLSKTTELSANQIPDALKVITLLVLTIYPHQFNGFESVLLFAVQCRRPLEAVRCGILGVSLCDLPLGISFKMLIIIIIIVGKPPVLFSTASSCLYSSRNARILCWNNT